MPKITLICPICNNNFEAYASSKRKTCSKSCYATHLSVTMVGKNNPNFGGHGWTDEKKKRQSEITKSRLTSDMRYKIGSANRGKKLSEFTCEKMSNFWKKWHSENERVISEKTREKIGEASKKKFTEEYKEKMRSLFEERGYWVPLSEKSDKELYYKESNWISRMFDTVDDPTQLSLLQDHGVFNCYSNKIGVVRDHVYSRRSGLEEGVFPELLRHPANCELMLNTNNVRKKRGRYNDADNQTKEELFDKIVNYQKPWKEQDLCLQLIERYYNGQRWSRQKGG